MQQGTHKDMSREHGSWAGTDTWKSEHSSKHHAFPESRSRSCFRKQIMLSVVEFLPQMMNKCVPGRNEITTA